MQWTCAHSFFSPVLIALISGSTGQHPGFRQRSFRNFQHPPLGLVHDGPVKHPDGLRGAGNTEAGTSRQP